MRRGWSLAGAAGLAFAGWGEWLNWRWIRTLVRDRRGGVVAVVVPGFRNRGTTANTIRCWRTRIGLRSVRGDDQTATPVFSGGAVGEQPAPALGARRPNSHCVTTGARSRSGPTFNGNGPSLQRAWREAAITGPESGRRSNPFLRSTDCGPFEGSIVPSGASADDDPGGGRWAGLRVV